MKKSTIWLVSFFILFFMTLYSFPAVYLYLFRSGQYVKAPTLYERYPGDYINPEGNDSLIPVPDCRVVVLENDAELIFGPDSAGGGVNYISIDKRLWKGENYDISHDTLFIFSSSATPEHKPPGIAVQCPVHFFGNGIRKIIAGDVSKIMFENIKGDSIEIQAAVSPEITFNQCEWNGMRIITNQGPALKSVIITNSIVNRLFLDLGPETTLEFMNNRCATLTARLHAGVTLKCTAADAKRLLR